MKPRTFFPLRFAPLAALVFLPVLPVSALAPSSGAGLVPAGASANAPEKSAEDLGGLDLEKLKKRFMAEAMKNNGQVKLNLETLSQWLVESGMKEERVKALKTEDYTAILQRAIGGKAGDGKGSPAHDDGQSWVGKPAPQVTLDLLGGGKLDLAAHKGNEIVVLDFWATWCGPCVESLPILDELAKTYGKKGVAFYAVNGAEDKETVQKFIESKKLTLPVALDTERAANESFKVSGIPYLVIIDKAGVVQVVHVGYGPNHKEQLTRELDALLLGKKPS